MKSHWSPPRAGRRRRALSLVLALALAGQGVAAPAVSAKTAPVTAGLVEAQPTSPIEIKVGVGPNLTHIEFIGAKPTGARREGDDMVLRFAVKTPPLLPRLHVDPPPFVKDASAKAVGGGVEVRLTLARDVQASSGEADGAYFLNLSASSSGAPSVRLDQLPGDRADPIPTDGAVRVTAAVEGAGVHLSFPWRAPLGSAVFRRGSAIFVVFDAPAGINLSAFPAIKSFGPKSAVRGIQTLAGRDYSGVRIEATPGATVTATAEGAVWNVLISESPADNAEAPQTDPINLVLDETASVGLSARMAGATGVFWVVDPVVGDRIGVVTALPPAKGVAVRRGFVGGAVLASAQGLALESALDDIKLQTSQDIVRISRDKGLSLSASALGAHLGSAPMGAPQAAAEPGLIDFANWSKVGEEGFIGRYHELVAAASDEAGEHHPGKVQARMALARFLVGSELTYEAIGVLNLLAKTDQVVLSNAEFRGLRGAAKAMAGRYKDAVAEFSAPALAEDRTAALWRGYVASKVGDMSGAHQQFALGRLAIGGFSGVWRSRFARADAASSLAVNDMVSAQRAILTANAAAAGDPEEMAAVKLISAKALEAAGQVQDALALYDDAAKASYGAVAAPATLRALQIRLDTGKTKTADAAATLDSLRFMWRGDATELEVVRALGRLDLNQGRYREALEVLRSAAKRLPDLPAASAIQTDLSQTFRALFFDGRADGLQPIQALGLFYDFKDLTPIGADGDAMVRKLAHRLVDVDLLPQAAELLKYQSEQRLEGVARADVSTDLATIYLMDRKPEQALQAINNSRTTVLPVWMNLQRRLLEARALIGLGRVDHAMEVIGDDKSPEAAALRAEAAWGAHDWPRAGGIFEGALADRWKAQTKPLSPDEEAELIRAGVAYSLANDDVSLLRLRSRYARLIEVAQNKDTLKLAVAGIGAGDASPAAYSRAMAESDLFSGWLNSAKKRLLDKTAVKTAQTAPAAAKPAPSGKKAG